MVVAAITMLSLLAVAAVVVDLAAARSDRADNQVTADAAAAAAAAEATAGTGQDGCAAAVAYAEEHLGATLGVSCSTIPASCSASTPSATVSGTVGAITVEITHPVPDTSALMTSASMGATAQAVIGDDGDQCGRFGVRVSEQRATFFGGVVGVEEQTTSVHAVALAGQASGQTRAINLLLLEKTDCPAISMSGSGGGVGGIAVAAVLNPVTGTVEPGVLAVDSDASGSGCSGNGTIDVNGSNSVIQANGPTGCPGELVAGTGQGCGEIQTVASGGPGCAMPACSSSGTVAPDPTKTNQRLTRAPIDWRYNCKSSYPSALGIDGCPYTGTNGPSIDQLVADIGGSGIPTGFSDYQAAGYPCNISGPPSTVVVVPEGNWYVGCNLSVNRTLTFTGGNVVFGGDVSVQSSATLNFNSAATATYSWSPPGPVDHREYSADAAYVYMQGGSFSKSGQGTVTFTGTMLYLSASSSISMGGGTSGSVDWSAPTEGPFEDLAMWSESGTSHGFAGQASLTLDGVFFAPVAEMRYSGNGIQQQVAAQFISETLAVSGRGQLIISPVFDRSILFPDVSYARLIR